MAASVTATAAATRTIGILTDKHGPLAFHQSGGCCDGSSPICLLAGELPPGPNDLLLGEVGGAPFYVDAEQFRRWRRPAFVLDVGVGAAEGFSLEALEQVHFVTRSPPQASGTDPESV